MKVLLVSEGKHEANGALEALVRRSVGKITDCTFDRVSRDDIHTHRGKAQGFIKRALRWLLEARKQRFDALVLVVDEDGDANRIAELAAAQQDQAITAGFPRALGIAIRTFDAWMLADEVALRKVLGIPVQTQPSPETCSDPKSQCADFLEQSTRSLGQSEFYREVAELMDLEKLANRCPRGFGVFAMRLKSL
jgi:hypothetical protein